MHCNRLLAVLSSSIVALSLFVPTSYAAQPTIAKITVLSANDYPAPTSLVSANMNLDVGETFDPAALTEDIKRLYGTGHFRHVGTKLNELTADTVEIVVTVTPKPVVRSILTEGNAEYSDNRLRALITHEVLEVLAEPTLAADTNSIRDYYLKKGFNDADVTRRIVPVEGTNQVDVVFTIVEGERQKLRAVKFVGNTVITSRKLRKALESKHRLLTHIFSFGYVNEDSLKVDRSAIAQLYHDMGYLDFRIEDLERTYNRRRTWVVLTYKLSEGKPYTVKSTELQGNSFFSDGELAEGLRVEAGGPYKASDERLDIRTIYNRYQSAGYLEAKCFADQEVDPTTHSVGIIYRISEGVASTIRNIAITGNKVTKDRVIRRELSILPDDKADMNKVRVSRNRLMNLNYFSSVEIDPIATEQPDRKDLRVAVTEQRTGQLMLGAGVSSEDDFVGMVEVSQGNFDITNWPRPIGGGQKLRLRLEAGTERSNFSLSFTEPWLFGEPLRLDTDLYDTAREWNEYTEEKTGLRIMLTKQWRKLWRRSIGFKVEQITLDEFDTTASQTLLDEAGTFDTHTLTIRATRDTRDRYVAPTSGSKMTVTLDLESELWGSYSNVYRLNLDTTKYIPVFSPCVLKLGARIGLVDDFSEDRVPIFDRFFAGGAYSLRGFKLREVGPIDENEDPIGGRSLLLGTTELVFPIFEQLQGSLFCDFGNVWGDAAAWDPSEFNVSVGAGIQFQLPIGPIRFDYGFPIVTQDDHLSTGGRLHFNIGYFF